jgi:hypothetical protein
MKGGMKHSKKGSKKSSKKGGRKPNPSFTAQIKLTKHISSKLGIPYGPKVVKVAAAVVREVKEKHPEVATDAEKLTEKGIEHYEKNQEHFKSML